jgi:hypothetical protein
VCRGSCGVLSSGSHLVSPVLQKIVRDGTGEVGWVLGLTSCYYSAVISGEILLATAGWGKEGGVGGAP